MKNKNLLSRILLMILTLVLILNNMNVSGQLPGKDTLEYKSKPDIKKLVAENRRSANTWWYSWLVGYSAATVVQTGIAVTSPELTTRQDMWNGAATTFLGVVGLIATPLVPKDSEVRRKVSYGMDPGKIYTDAEYSRIMLKEIARREQFGRSWKVHAITGVVNIGSGLVTWLGFKRTIGDGLVTFAINTAITEAQIWSQPIRAVKDYNRYIHFLNNGTLAGPSLPARQWIFSATPGGVNIRFRF